MQSVFNPNLSLLIYLTSTFCLFYADNDNNVWLSPKHVLVMGGEADLGNL